MTSAAGVSVFSSMPQLFSHSAVRCSSSAGIGERIGHHEAAFAQVRHLEQGDVGLAALHVVVDEVVHIGRLVGVDPLDGFPHRAVERAIGLRIDAIGGDFGAVKE